MNNACKRPTGLLQNCTLVMPRRLRRPCEYWVSAESAGCVKQRQLIESNSNINNIRGSPLPCKANMLEPHRDFLWVLKSPKHSRRRTIENSKCPRYARDKLCVVITLIFQKLNPPVAFPFYLAQARNSLSFRENLTRPKPAFTNATDGSMKT